MTRMYLVHSEPAASSPPNISFTRETENSFSNTEDQADDGSFLQVSQVSQDQSRSRSILTSQIAVLIYDGHRKAVFRGCWWDRREGTVTDSAINLVGMGQIDSLKSGCGPCSWVG